MSHPAEASLARLEALVDGVIAALTAGRQVDHAEMAEAKGRALLELSRHTPPRDPDEALAARVGRVRAKLAEEERLLAVRLRAAELVSDVVAEAIQQEDWDGTYGPQPAFHAPVRKDRASAEGGG